jgi:hypothetical protein
VKAALADEVHRGSGSVYFIGNLESRWVKIGYVHEKEPTSRKRNIQVASPFPIEVLGWVNRGQSFEKHLHNIFSMFHIRGEWFFLAAPIQSAIKAANESRLSDVDEDEEALYRMWQKIRSGEVSV